jgi:hypothetical protein
LSHEEVMAQALHKNEPLTLDGKHYGRLVRIHRN